MKMLGSMTSSAIRDMIAGIEHQMGSDCRPRDMPVSIPRDTLVALFHEYQEAMTCHFYYELGRSIRLDENQLAVQERVPSKYMAHFNLGTKDREAIEAAENKCTNCNKIGRKLRGRLTPRHKETNENANRQQEVQV